MLLASDNCNDLISLIGEALSGCCVVGHKQHPPLQQLQPVSDSTIRQQATSERHWFHWEISGSLDLLNSALFCPGGFSVCGLVVSGHVSAWFRWRWSSCPDYPPLTPVLVVFLTNWSHIKHVFATFQSETAAEKG